MDAAAAMVIAAALRVAAVGAALVVLIAMPLLHLYQFIQPGRFRPGADQRKGRQRSRAGLTGQGRRQGKDSRTKG